MSFYYLVLIFILSYTSVFASPTKEPTASVLIVRGLIRENAHNQSFMDLVHKMKPDWQVLSFDIPGNGSRHEETSFTSIQQNSDFLRKQWLKKATAQRKIILGISLGGMMVLDWMKRYPQDFDSFLVANSSQSNFCSLWERVMPSSFGYLFTVALPFSNRSKEVAIRDMTINLKTDDQKLLNSWVEIRDQRPVTFINVLRQMWAGLGFNFEEQRLGAPLKVLVSQNDRMVSSECSKRLASFYNVPLFIHPTAGHDISNDDPEWIIGQIDSTLTGLHLKMPQDL